jgi:HAD superfamily hydrolase (TIGR01484 family)
MRLLVCTDLDRTLVPNGRQPESPGARIWFKKLAALPEVTLAYVTGRDQQLVRDAIREYDLPIPHFVLADVGSSIYVCSDREWISFPGWQAHIAQGWEQTTQSRVVLLLDEFPELRLQEESKQNTFKLSYYAPVSTNYNDLQVALRKRLQDNNIEATLIWSLDEAANAGLLDILPARAGKRYAIEFLMEKKSYRLDNTVFSGDSGNDLPVLVSPIPSTLVCNATIDVKQEAQHLVSNLGTEQSLYLARGGFEGMNGNYAAGIMEGVCYYHPELLNLLEYY